MVSLENDWDEILKDEWQKPYYLALREFLKDEYRSRRIYPPMHDIYNALRYTPYEGVKVLIVGQDPYHGEGQAHGLCFSVKEGIKQPPSLVNIFKELESEYGMPRPESGELTGWAKQGVLLLNTALTVREGQPNSHRGKGWEILTDKIISLVDQKNDPVVFLLWGSNARQKKALIHNKAHLVLECAHPSHLSAYQGFFGCGHFRMANEFLMQNGKGQIDWSKTH